MLMDGSLSTRAAGNAVLQQNGFSGNGELGVIPFIPILIAGSGLILGGGSLWVLHEKHTEKEAYQECLNKMTVEPYNMPPMEAAQVCKGEPEEGGFKFGLNVGTLVLTAGSVFGLWYLTRVMLAAGSK